MNFRLLSPFFMLLFLVFFVNCSAADDIICASAGQVPDGDGGCRYEESSAELEKRLKLENEYNLEEEDYLSNQDEK